MPNRHDRRAASKTKPAKAVVNVRETNLTFPTDVKPLFSDGLLVQFSGEVAVLSFLKAIPTIKDSVRPADIETRCVAQIAVGPSQMAENLKVMNAQFKAFVSAQDDDVKAFLFEKAGMKGSE